MKYKALVRVVKSMSFSPSFSEFAGNDVLTEPFIEAEDKNGVKLFMAQKYPQFFNGKVYERENRDTAQFFYVVIFPLQNWEIEQIGKGPWTCAHCGQNHENQYLSKPTRDEKHLGDDMMFCKSPEDYCLKAYMRDRFRDAGLADNLKYVNAESASHIYKCTQKSTGKCYVGKTRNAPFHRWWDHISNNSTLFGRTLRETLLSDWTFEVIDVLPPYLTEAEVFKIESEWILKCDSIANGFNVKLSSKEVSQRIAK